MEKSHLKIRIADYQLSLPGEQMSCRLLNVYFTIDILDPPWIAYKGRDIQAEAQAYCKVVWLTTQLIKSKQPLYN